MEKPPKAEPQPGGSAEQVLEALEREMSVLSRRMLRVPWVEREDGVRLDRWTYALLVRMAEEGPMRVREVARRFGLDKSTASRLLRRLEEQGLVGSVPDEEDGCSALLRITPGGRALLGRTREERLRFLGRLFGSWEEEERHQLAQLLARLNGDLDGEEE